MRIIEVTHPKAEQSEDNVVVLVNIKTGKLRQIPCGPIEAAHHSGHRLVYWNDKQRKPEIPAKHQSTWRFYESFCADPKVAKSVNLSVEASKAYFPAYIKFIKAIGLGAQAKQLVGVKPEDVQKVYHPALLPLREAHSDAHGQDRVFGPDLIARVIADLPDVAEQNTAVMTKALEGEGSER